VWKYKASISSVQKFDPETGLYYYGGRYYDAEIGRFISADPFVQEPLDPQNLNRYSYVLNSPQNYTDPSGYFHRHKVKHRSFLGFFLGSFFGAIAGIIVGPSVAAWAGASASAGGLGLSAIGANTLGAAAAGFAGGFVSSALQGNNPMLGGLIGGASAALLAYTGASLFSNDGIMSANSGYVQLYSRV
jgi:RHS repeat-associated protein